MTEPSAPSFDSNDPEPFERDGATFAHQAVQSDQAGQFETAAFYYTVSMLHQMSHNIKNIMKTCLFKYIEHFITRNWKFSGKNSDIFHISAQNIDCGYSLELPQWGSSNKYPQSMFLSRNKKNNMYPCKPQFYCIKVGFKGVKII